MISIRIEQIPVGGLPIIPQLMTELRRVGATVSQDPTGLINIEGPPKLMTLILSILDKFAPDENYTDS